jgi:hypothetical protein
LRQVSVAGSLEAWIVEDSAAGSVLRDFALGIVQHWASATDSFQSFRRATAGFDGNNPLGFTVASRQMGHAFMVIQ